MWGFSEPFERYRYTKILASHLFSGVRHYRSRSYMSNLVYHNQHLGKFLHFHSREKPRQPNLLVDNYQQIYFCSWAIGLIHFQISDGKLSVLFVMLISIFLPSRCFSFLLYKKVTSCYALLSKLQKFTLDCHKLRRKNIHKNISRSRKTYLTIT